MKPENEKRADCAAEGLNAWRAAHGRNGSDEADARDLITDLLHLIEREHDPEIGGPERQHDMAWGNYEAER